MVFQNAIRIVTTSKDEYTFTSFWGNNRDGCFDLIAKTRNRVLNELKPAVVRGLQRTSVALGSSDNSTTGEPFASTSPVTSPVSMAAAAKAVAAAQQLQLHEETDDADSDAENTHTEDVSTSRPDTVHEAHDNSSHQQQENDDLHVPVRRVSVVSDIGSVAPKDISMTQIVEDTFDLSVDEFMAEFFWDDAKFGLDAFGASQGSTEIKCNPWMTPLEDDDSSFGTCFGHIAWLLVLHGRLSILTMCFSSCWYHRNDAFTAVPHPSGCADRPKVVPSRCGTRLFVQLWEL